MPAFEEIFIANVTPLFKEHGDSDVRLFVDGLIESQVWVGEFVRNRDFAGSVNALRFRCHGVGENNSTDEIFSNGASIVFLELISFNRR